MFLSQQRCLATRGLVLLLTSLWCTLAGAAEVRVAFAEKIAPFCFPESNSGIEVDLFREALAYRDHVLKPKYYSVARIALAFKSHEVDAATSDLGEDMRTFGAYYGVSPVHYDNIFITLKERHLAINRPDDLRGLTVIAFVGAAKRYPDWLAQVQKEGRYFEQNNQELQVLTLNRGRYDVAVSDRTIFRYYSLLLKRQQKYTIKETAEHDFVFANPMDYRPVFTDSKIRDDFNAGLQHLKDSGRIDAIYRHYLSDAHDK